MGSLLALLTWTGAVAASSSAETASQADLCLEMIPEGLTDADWTRIVEQVAVVLAPRTALFPQPQVSALPPLAEGAAGEPLGSRSARLDIHSGHAGISAVGQQGDASASPSAACLTPGREWTARFGRDFLEASADRMLAEAPTTPGIDSEVNLEWHRDETRVRTLLVFAGPLDIPNGRCWVDDVLSIDPSTGVAVASGEQGLETSPFAEGACGRFFGYLPDGGAGEQAVTLLPTEIEFESGRTLRFVATDVVVDEGAISVSGTLEWR